MASGTSYRAFARLLGVSQPAVSKAVASGRLTESVVGKDEKGKPVIVDVEGARREWEANASKPTKPRPRRKGPTLADAQRSVAIERAKRLEFDNAVRRGHYVPLEEAKREAFESSRVIREGLLNLAARIAPELAAETDPHRLFLQLDAEIRAALGQVADALDRVS